MINLLIRALLINKLHNRKFNLQKEFDKNQLFFIHSGTYNLPDKAKKVLFLKNIRYFMTNINVDYQAFRKYYHNTAIKKMPRYFLWGLIFFS